MARSPLMDLAFGYMPAQIVHAAADWGWPTALADGPRSSEDLAKATGAHAPSLHRLLRGLATLGAVEQRERDLFALTAEGRRGRARDHRGPRLLPVRDGRGPRRRRRHAAHRDPARAQGPRGLLFDLPAGLAAASGTLGEVACRVEIVAGDFFESVPGGADAYVLKSVLHDWSDGKAAAILRNVREAMRPDARLLILEQVMPEIVTPEAAGIVRNDLNMLVATGGCERTEAGFRDLLDAAGFTGVSFTGPLPPAAYHVIEAGPGK